MFSTWEKGFVKNIKRSCKCTTKRFNSIFQVVLRTTSFIFMYFFVVGGHTYIRYPSKKGNACSKFNIKTFTILDSA